MYTIRHEGLAVERRHRYSFLQHSKCIAFTAIQIDMYIMVLSFKERRQISPTENGIQFILWNTTIALHVFCFVNATLKRKVNRRNTISILFLVLVTRCYCPYKMAHKHTWACFFRQFHGHQLIRMPKRKIETSRKE